MRCGCGNGLKHGLDLTPSNVAKRSPVRWRATSIFHIQQDATPCVRMAGGEAVGKRPNVPTALRREGPRQGQAPARENGSPEAWKRAERRWCAPKNGSRLSAGGSRIGDCSRRRHLNDRDVGTSRARAALSELPESGGRSSAACLELGVPAFWSPTSAVGKRPNACDLL